MDGRGLHLRDVWRACGEAAEGAGGPSGLEMLKGGGGGPREEEQRVYGGALERDVLKCCRNHVRPHGC